MLGENDGKPIIDVHGHPAYRDDGQLRMTTVSVTQRDATLDLFTLMKSWASRDDAVYPFFAQYGTSGSQQQDAQEGQVEMVTSQDAAAAAALTQLHPAIEIGSRHRRHAGRRSRSATCKVGDTRSPRSATSRR